MNAVARSLKSKQPEVDTADADREDLGWALGMLLRAHRDQVGPVLTEFPHGPRGYQTLAEVARGKQPSQLALANHLGIDRTVMTYLIDDLERAGLVERRPNPDDRRQRQVVATREGVATISALCQRVAQAEDDVLAGLDDAERSVLRRLLFKATCGEVSTGDPCKLVPELG